MRVIRRAGAITLTLLCAGVPLEGVDAETKRAASNGGRFVEVARIPFAAATEHSGGSKGGKVVLDVPRRLGFRFVQATDGGVEGFRISSFELDTYEEGPTATFRGDYSRAGGALGPPVAIGGGTIYVVDAQNRLWVIDELSLALRAMHPAPLASQDTNAGTRVFSPGDMATDLSSQVAARRTPLGVYQRIGAIAYLPPTPQAPHRRLLLLTESIDVGSVGAPENPNPVALTQWNADTGAQDWTAFLNACRAGRGKAVSKFGMGLALSSPPGTSALEAVVGCIGRGQGGEIWKVGLKPDGTGIDTQVSAGSVPLATDFHVDAVGRRVLVQTSGGPGQTVVGVDIDRRGVYGTVLTSVSIGDGIDDPDQVSAGLDPVTGRLYALARPSQADLDGRRRSPGGVLLIDGRRAPLPQGLAFPSLNPERRSGNAQIVVEPASPGRATRVYIRFGGIDGEFPEPFLRVFEDTFPTESEAGLGDLDRFTAGVPEQAGVTRSTFNASGTAYGARTIFVGGMYAAGDPVTYVGGGSPTRAAPDSVAQMPCMHTDREVTFASVERGTVLSDTGAGAGATPGLADPRTKQDLAAPVGSCPTTKLLAFLDSPWPSREATAPVDAAAGRRWPFEQARCNAGDGRVSWPHADVRDQPPPGYTATVECDRDGNQIDAKAFAGPNSEGPISVGAAFGRVNAKRRDGGGVVVESSAYATGINIAGLTIARVEATARSEAAGRPGTARASFQRRWCGIALPSGPVTQSCVNPDEQSDLLRQINDFLATRGFTIDLVSLDTELVAGTKGGALAASQKDRFNAIGDRLLNNDDSTAVPALQVFHAHDDARKGRGRQLYQLAGVEASTSYFVTLVPEGSPSILPSPNAVSGTDRPDDSSTTTEGIVDGTGSAGSAAPSMGLASAASDEGAPLFSPRRLLRAIRTAVEYVLRNPGEAFAMAALIAFAFALPIHLFERRRALLVESTEVL
ncbi:MAG: hypothetical protein M3394_04170 [Actinomycetota bacterium]|nr:hypothetical protein [Actinomycetota bacterium]